MKLIVANHDKSQLHQLLGSEMQKKAFLSHYVAHKP